MRPFAQQFRELASRPIPVTASTLLAYIFETILRPDQARSVAALPPPLGFLRPRRVRSAHGTRCLVQSRDSWFVCELFGSPPGPLNPSGSKPQPYREPRSSPCKSPDLLSLPAAPQKLLMITCATDHRSRSATSCQAHCPSNLLEPQSSCSLRTSAVN